MTRPRFKPGDKVEFDMLGQTVRGVVVDIDQAAGLEHHEDPPEAHFVRTLDGYVRVKYDELRKAKKR